MTPMYLVEDLHGLAVVAERRDETPIGLEDMKRWLRENDIQSKLHRDSAWHLPWLLQPDNPSVRLFALRGLLRRPADDPQVREAQSAVMHSPPVQAILSKFSVPHYWDRLDDDAGEYTRARAHSVWMLLLAALGADPAHPLVRQGCEFLFQTMQRDDGAFPSRHPVYGGVRTCTQGLTTEALLRLSPIERVRTPGFSRETPAEAGRPSHAEPATSPGLDPRLERAIGFAAAMDFECPYNGNLPCAWGVVKLLRAMAAVPANQRNSPERAAIERGVDLLLRYDLAQAGYPHSEAVSPEWRKFGFPRGYQSDVLETLDTLAFLGCAPDRRLEAAVGLVVSKQGPDGRWCSEFVSPRAQEVGIDREGEPSKWITLRALHVLDWWRTEGEVAEGFPVLKPVVK